MQGLVTGLLRTTILIDECVIPARHMFRYATVLALVLTACGAHTTPRASLQPTAQQPTEVAVNTLRAHPQVQITSTASPHEEEVGLRRCVSSEPQPAPEGFGLQGAIAYFDVSARREVLIGGTPVRVVPIILRGRDVPMEQDGLSLISFSPDGRWLAFRTLEARPSLVLLDEKGETIVVRPDASEVFGPLSVQVEVVFGDSRWVNGRLLQMHLVVGGPGLETREDHAFVNPFTGEWNQSLLTALPDRSPRGALAVSPNLTRALYLQLVPDSGLSRSREDLVLWDYTEGKVIWRMPDRLDELMSEGLAIPHLVEWSPDGSFVAFITRLSGSEVDLAGAGQWQVFLLSKDGKTLRQLTAFAVREARPAPDLSWSPDGRYLAFGVHVADDPALNRRLYVYDVRADALVEVCLLVGDTYRSSDRFLVWSPDSEWLAYVAMRGTQSLEEPTPLIILNVVTGEHYRVVEFASNVAGWSDKFRVPDK